DREKVFPNADILVPEPEWAFWMDDANMGSAEGAVKRYFLNARRIFKDISSEVKRFKPGDEVAPGVVSVPAYGHTPGHTAFAIHSGNQSMLAMSDTVRNPYLFARNPNWQPTFDMDGPQAGAAGAQWLDGCLPHAVVVEPYPPPPPPCGHMNRPPPGTNFARAAGHPWSPRRATGGAPASDVSCSRATRHIPPGPGARTQPG